LAQGFLPTRFTDASKLGNSLLSNVCRISSPHWSYQRFAVTQ